MRDAGVHAKQEPRACGQFGQFHGCGPAADSINGKTSRSTYAFNALTFTPAPCEYRAVTSRFEVPDYFDPAVFWPGSRGAAGTDVDYAVAALAWRWHDIRVQVRVIYFDFYGAKQTLPSRENVI
jgi:hypothetical protein